MASRSRIIWIFVITAIIIYIISSFFLLLSSKKAICEYPDRRFYGGPLMNKETVFWLYEEYVKKENEYYDDFNKYTENKNSLPLPESFDLDLLTPARVMALLQLKEFVKKYNLKSEKLLTPVKDPELQILPHEEIIFHNYDPETEHGDYHVLDREMNDYDFDFVLICQTHEHLYDPFLVNQLIFEHMKPGGYFYTHVPVLNIQHSTPIHFLHFQPMSLAMMLYRAGFEILEVGSWGNEEYIDKLNEDNYWPNFNAMDDPGKNDKRRPVITWALARKPLDGKKWYLSHNKF